MKKIRELVGGEAYEYVPLGTHVVRATGVCGGRPTFKYTRIEVAGVLARLDNGETVDAVVAGFCDRVPREALDEAISLTAAGPLGTAVRTDFRLRAG